MFKVYIKTINGENIVVSLADDDWIQRMWKAIDNGEKLVIPRGSSILYLMPYYVGSVELQEID